MARLRSIGFLLALLFATAKLPADTINFDDIDASAGDVILGRYAGYSFTNFSAYTTVPGFPGFNNGIVSGPNAAYSSDSGSITSATSVPTFDFTGGSFGSGYYDGLTVTVQGLLGGVLYDSQTITVNTEGAQAFAFDFIGIDTLQFTTGTTAATIDPYYCGAVGCSYFTLDDAVLTPDAAAPGPPIVTPPPPPAVTPEPPSLLLLSLGLLAMLPAWRTRFSHR